VPSKKTNPVNAHSRWAQSCNVTEKICIGVSRCLLGDAVRYDGQSKPSAIAIEQLAEQFELIPICPEVEAGLSIPRPPVQLRGRIDSLRLIGRDDPKLEITGLMHDYCEQKLPKLEQLAGFIAKSRSPSCGYNSTPVFTDNGEATSLLTSGIFTQSLVEHRLLPIIEETQLEQPSLLNAFIQAVNEYDKRLTSSD